VTLIDTVQLLLHFIMY